MSMLPRQGECYKGAPLRSQGATRSMAKAAPDATMPSAAPEATTEPHGATGFWTLSLGSVGVVYGDIGTSPLYAFREAVTAASEGGPITRANVLGVLSLILWALIIVVTLKYVLILLRADNNGEGGTLSLMALAFRGARTAHAPGRAARDHRRRDVPRRFRHHAGDLGALGGGGPQAWRCRPRSSISCCRSRS